MSYDTHKTWLYRLEGRYIHLWQYIQGAATTTLGDYKIRLPGEYYGNQLIYPNEDITNGLRIEYTALIEPFVGDAWEDLTARISGTSFIFQDTSTAIYTGSSNLDFAATGKRINFQSGEIDTSIAFYDGQSIVVSGTSSNNGTFTVAGGGVNTNQLIVTETVVNEDNTSGVIKSATGAILGGTAGTNTFTDFLAADKIRVNGSASNDGDYTVSSIPSNGDALVVSSAPSAVEAAGESITIYQIPAEDATPDETNHVNLNRLLSLSVVDYLKAQLADMQGNVQMKEYYMREFWKKVGDNESNKRKISMTFPTAPFAVR